jgi:putative ABC transport system permease protein
LALLILGAQFSKKQIDTLLTETQGKKHRKASPIWISFEMILGVLFLIAAYSNAIKGNAWENLKLMGITVLIGVVGTILVFHGIGILFDVVLSKHKNRNGLGIFTFRQVQESVFQKPNLLAVSSLLILSALCCFAYGIAVGCIFHTVDTHVLDYTFQGDGKVIQSELQKANLGNSINHLFEMKVGSFSYDVKTDFSAQELINDIKKSESSPARDTLINNLARLEYPYMISLSSYNQLLKLSGKQEIKLKADQVALYNSTKFSNADTIRLLNNTLREKPNVQIYDKSYQLIEGIYQDNIVTDKRITISYGLIVPDELYAKLIPERGNNSFWNATLKKDYVKEKGLLLSITEINKILDKTNLDYESYLQNMGRSLFYTVAASYTTLYLAIIFLIISNTVMGAQFLMHQQKAKKRYQTLIRLGADYESLCKSAREQITWYFSIPLFVAAVSAIFGTRSLFTGAVTSSMHNSISSLMLVAIAMILFASVIEFCYMISVKRLSDRNMRKIMEIKREDD